MKSIYDYTDHLKFIKDKLQILKKDHKNYTHRSIAHKFSKDYSPALLTHIFKGSKLK